MLGPRENVVEFECIYPARSLIGWYRPPANTISIPETARHSILITHLDLPPNLLYPIKILLLL